MCTLIHVYTLVLISISSQALVCIMLQFAVVSSPLLSVHG